MPFDGIVTKAITTELREKLIGGRISKIYQPTQTELLFTIRNQRQNFNLLLSIHPSYSRFHLTDTSFQNPEEPPMFCMHLRKHLLGAILLNIEQQGLERIIIFRFHALNEIGDAVSKTLIFEIMGRHSNIILLQEEAEKIINCMKHVPPTQNRYRSLLPGAPYKMPPPQDKLNLLESSEEDFLKKLDFNAGKMDKQIVGALTGVSPLIAREFVHRTHLGSQSVFKEEFLKLKEIVQNEKFEPSIFVKDGREDFHVIPITFMEKKESFNSANEMVDAFYANKAERDLVKQKTNDLLRLIKNELDKNKRKLDIHEKTLQEAEKAERYQKFGELLTANMHLVKKGDTEINVIDYYDPDQNEITIPLQIDKTPSENAQNYFKKYRKLQAAEEKAMIEIEKTEKEVQYLESILQQIENARPEDIEEIREELREEGYLKNQVTKKRKKDKPMPDKYVASDGTVIYVGRNNKQNEYVTHRLANRNDIWLHTLNIPGSHVVIKSSNPSEETLFEAAQLAAYFSKARQSQSVPVDYTEIKYVKKPSGAKPGFVTYTEQKTIYVTPDEKVIEKLKSNKA